MKNKVELKRMLIITSIVIVIFLAIFSVFYLIQYRTYTMQFNEKLNSIIAKLVEEYPDIEKNEWVAILNGKEDANTDLLIEYGIDLEKDSFILENDAYFQKFWIQNLLLLIVLIGFIFLMFCIYNGRKNKKLAEITSYIEQINKRNYSLDIDGNTEDELSILKNEIYKTTIMLKEVAENARNQELSLKNSLEDISHQLKTPLTSIMIMLDSMIDDENMDKETRTEFIKDCKKEITNINFLVQALLKLSKFDANTITFHNQKFIMKEIIEEAVSKVSVLCDLKNIEIDIHGNETDWIECDFKWQVEAITNLLKNAVEYSENSSKIEVRYNQNKLYAQITIHDHGKGIDEEDLPHIFERFYKGKNSQKDSVGIGLALAKTIIEKNNGRVQAESEINKGTTFVVKYF